MAMFSETAPLAVAHRPDHRAASGVLMALFFAIGFLTCLNDIIVPHFKDIFALDYTRAMLIQFSFFAAYFVVSAPSGIAIKWASNSNALVGFCVSRITMPPSCGGTLVEGRLGSS